MKSVSDTHVGGSHFCALAAGQDWVEFSVLASVCPKCGTVELNVAVPAQFATMDCWMKRPRTFAHRSLRGFERQKNPEKHY
jgi:rRNA maturation protein Nop10